MNKMRFVDFIRDRIAFAVVYFISISLVILVMGLTTFIKTSDFPMPNILYAYIVSIVLFIIFFIYEYSKVRLFYNNLTEALNSENIIESIINVGDAQDIEQKLFLQVLGKLHRSYTSRIYKYEETQEQFSNFINQWVHQMKTPVSVINLILQDETMAESKEILQSIGEENEKISQGLNIMLYNARINEFNHDFNVEDINIVLILRKVINDNKKLLIRGCIFPKITGGTTFVHTDKKWVYFVINQIVINAIKYTNAAVRNKKTINFKIEDKLTKIVLSIEDNGIGIPNEDLGRVFNAFFTGKNGRKTFESTGMGMYLSKRICEELGHELNVESDEGKRTNFCIGFFKAKNIFKL